MTAKKDLAEKRERVRAAMYEKAQSAMRAHLTEQHASLDEMCAKAAAGDRKSMLQLIEVTSETLHAFDLLSEELRGKLADGLNEIVKVLSQSPDFIKKNLSRMKRREAERNVWWTAWQVEHIRDALGLNLDEAMAHVADHFHMTQSLVHKRWKGGHKEAKEEIKNRNDLLKLIGYVPTYRRTPKKVR